MKGFDLRYSRRLPYQYCDSCWHAAVPMRCFGHGIPEISFSLYFEQEMNKSPNSFQRRLTDMKKSSSKRARHALSNDVSYGVIGREALTWLIGLGTSHPKFSVILMTPGGKNIE